VPGSSKSRVAPGTPNCFIPRVCRDVSAPRRAVGPLPFGTNATWPPAVQPSRNVETVVSPLPIFLPAPDPSTPGQGTSGTACSESFRAEVSLLAEIATKAGITAWTGSWRLPTRQGRSPMAVRAQRRGAVRRCAQTRRSRRVPRSMLTRRHSKSSSVSGVVTLSVICAKRQLTKHSRQIDEHHQGVGCEATTMPVSSPLMTHGNPPGFSPRSALWLI